jgi:hypothetical protein
VSVAKVICGKSELSTDANSIHNDFFGNLVHGASDSADNRRAAVSTTHCFTDECYNKRSTRGDGDRGACVSSDSACEPIVNYSTVQWCTQLLTLYTIVHNMAVQSLVR